MVAFAEKKKRKKTEYMLTMLEGPIDMMLAEEKKTE